LRLRTGPLPDRPEQCEARDAALLLSHSRPAPFPAQFPHPHNKNKRSKGASMAEQSSNVIAFRRPAARPASSRHPKGLIETVYAAGSIPVSGEDIATKTAAVMLQGLGFLVIEEVLADGTSRPLARGETRQALRRPWRLSKPAFAGVAGLPDASGAFI
jgi:hypothetical protein